MSPDSDLMECLGVYASIPPTTPTSNPTVEQAKYYCDLYSQLADCWSFGRYCLEWRPLEIEAQKFCALAAQEEPAYPTLTSVIIEASNVVSSIWHNDVGTAIPSPPVDNLVTTSLPTWTSVPRDGASVTAATDNSITPAQIFVTPGGSDGPAPPELTATASSASFDPTGIIVPPPSLLPHSSDSDATETTCSCSSDDPTATGSPVIVVGGASNNGEENGAVKKITISLLASSAVLLTMLAA
ncbi:hypothetical protein BT69DRAFT_1320211 [Atractiella rhizophila]|nr:hypothetical protein BT69DRAFT_1320211 [Atractiella rhizophila]